MRYWTLESPGLHHLHKYVRLLHVAQEIFSEILIIILSCSKDCILSVFPSLNTLKQDSWFTVIILRMKIN